MLNKITIRHIVKSEQRLPWITCFLSGMFMGITCDPINAWFLAWFALIPLWIWLIHQQQFQWYQLIPAITFAFGYYGVTLFWITGVHPMTWMGVPWLASLVIAIFCWICLIAWGTVLVLIWSSAMIVIARKLYNSLQRVLLGVTLWCSLETLWSYTPLHWTTLALTQSPQNLPILQWLSVSGTTTVTAIIMAVNGLLAEAVINRCKKRRFSPNVGLTQAAIAILVTFHLVGGWLYLRPIDTPQNQALRVGIIQGNVPNEIKLYPEGRRKAIAGYTQGYVNLAQAGADAILTPETALPFQWPEQVYQRSQFDESILEQGVPVWLGAFGTKQERYTNSLYSITGKGKTLARFDKVHLVPLGEYIPLESVLGTVVDRLSPLDSHLAKGSPDQTFMTPFGKAIVGICYESAYGEHFRRQAASGGKFILSASNDDHYRETMPAQHHAQDVMRAIETDRAAVRATNTGYSAIVDSRGNTLWRSQMNEYQTYLGTIDRRDTTTLYVRWGNWLNWTLAGVAVVIVAFTGIGRNRDF